MPSKKTASNTQSQKSKLHLRFPSSKGAQILIFMLVFGVVGGGIALYKTYAASYPPTNITGAKYVGKVIATDGYNSEVVCVNSTSITGFGQMTPCLQKRNSGSELASGISDLRPGNYNLSNGTFYPTGGWQKYNLTGGTFTACSNRDNYFGSNGISLKTGFGPIAYGQLYRISTRGAWQVSWVNMNTDTRTCTAPGTWYNVLPGLH